MGKKDKKASSMKEGDDASRLRIAIVNSDRCKPKKCRQECKRNCPVVRTGKLCIEVDSTSKIAWISETLCIGCGICVKKCPFEAISIINLPKDLGKETTHRFGPNTFKLHRLPVPRSGQVLGLVGTNGIGKSTALKILAGKLKPNLGNYSNPPEWSDILISFRGSELQNFFKHMLEDDIKAIIKPQYVDHITKQVEETMLSIFQRIGNAERVSKVMEDLELSHLKDRNVKDLSGGELQRFAIATVIVRDSDVYMFDEPSSYLDVSQRIRAAQVIRNVVNHNNYIIVVEHDLSVLDYLSDYVCCLWGKPGAYGVVTTPFSVREGINVFLEGFIPTENLRFREESLNFKVTVDVDDAEEEIKRLHFYKYPPMVKQLGSFKLAVSSGDFSESEIIVLLGKNGAGKTTLIRMEWDGMEWKWGGVEVGWSGSGVEWKWGGVEVGWKWDGVGWSGVGWSGVEMGMLAGVLAPDNMDAIDMPKLTFLQPLFQTDVIKPMQLDNLYDQEVQFLSGGELQRVALVVALGKPADIYLIDEPSAHLDSEQRIIAARVIKRFVLHTKKTAFVVEHDFIMATYLADRVIVFDGNVGKRLFGESLLREISLLQCVSCRGFTCFSHVCGVLFYQCDIVLSGNMKFVFRVDCIAHSPEPLVLGMNCFLAKLEITFRRDPTNYRPRINKLDSVKDKDQKLAGTYFLLED
ncbi:putative ATP-binding cassette sub-family E member 1 [Cardiosporidium cionae]|uniref:ATP-binding cassette sub-family E member 1 n=1 Tax=Cardiosporidium cionae TaxID=476202 RepID=A0ABQ7JC42_9APIC|nr:putative ATP-binding cassette sub-family E member 1 [Cardiosporidium cionae]|eukprot:KAF8821524.1 putative ATP-binding cassette sub-family E member 1 [Cardiosporidium cionae]